MPSDVDEQVIPRRGSALQIAYYVTCEQRRLSVALTPGGGERRLDWRSPVPPQRFVEYKDKDFLRAVGHADLADELAKWWPTSGPSRASAARRSPRLASAPASSSLECM